MKAKELNLEHLSKELIREYGLVKVLQAIINACDSSADFAHSCNEKRVEDYWRRAAVAVFDAIRFAADFPEKSRKY